MDGRGARPPGGPRWLYWRFWVQAASALLANNGLLQSTKAACWPGLNCWACPTASFACPIGALQNSLGAWRWTLAGSGLAAAMVALPWYILGGLLVAGALVGRMVCGWICPFGWFQDLLARIPVLKLRLPRPLGYARYLVLVGLVGIVAFWTGQPWFCKLCPQGFLEGGLPQPLLRPELRSGIGWLWYTKLGIFALFAVGCVFVARLFCATACPLGAIYALMNRYSLWRTTFLRGKCVNCLWCVKHCPAGIDPRRELEGHLCVSCLECQKCPFGAIVSAPAWEAARLVQADAEGSDDRD